jgi:uncharacterized membrane protein YuzA (DUF378 family)
MNKLAQLWSSVAKAVGSGDLIVKAWNWGTWLVGLVTSVLLAFQASVGDKIPLSAAIAIGLVGLAAVLAIGRIAGPSAKGLLFSKSDNKPPFDAPEGFEVPWATSDELKANVISGRRLFLYDLPRDSQSVIRGKVIEQCVVFGPAIIAAAGPGNYFTGTNFSTASPETTFISLHAPNGTPLVGVIGLAHCHIIRSKVINVAFIGPPNAMAVARRDVLGDHDLPS